MQITEVLITGYDGDEAVLAVNLGAVKATVVLTSTNHEGETVVKAVLQRDTDALTTVRDLVDNLVGVAAQAAS